jgi:hypothetical protein
VFERIDSERKDFVLRRMIMKRLILLMTAVLMVVGTAHATGGGTPEPGDIINIDNNINNSQSQTIENNAVQEAYVTGGDSISKAQGGDADADSSSSSKASVNTTSISNYESRMPPVTTFPPYLPYWNHGGWGTIKAYFSNGPNKDDRVYERTFDPDNAEDNRELRSVLESLPHDGPIEFLGGILNGVGALFCGPDNYHHGRGFQIANSLVRQRRRKGAPLLVFIDTSVDTSLLRKAGYAYVGKVSLEGSVDRNWDQVYDAAVAETLPWDVDILLVSGGMKGVTVGSSGSFPGAGGAYGETNYSVSMFGSVTSGITEGKGKAVVSAEAYRYSPSMVNRTAIPKSFYDRIRAGATVSARPARRPTQSSVQPKQRIWAPDTRRQVGRAEVAPSAPVASNNRTTRRTRALQNYPTSTSIEKKNIAGVEISRRCWEIAGFDKDDMVDYVIIR